MGTYEVNSSPQERLARVAIGAACALGREPVLPGGQEVTRRPPSQRSPVRGGSRFAGPRWRPGGPSRRRPGQPESARGRQVLRRPGVAVVAAMARLYEGQAD